MVSLRPLPALAVSVLISAATPVSGHDFERTRVALTFARDGSFVLDVTNDQSWLTQRLATFAAGRTDLAGLGVVFRDRVVLFVDGREIRPDSVEFVPAAPPVERDAPILATYRLHGRMPAVARTLRWYYGLVVDPYPLVVQRADGRSSTETIYGEAWSRAIDISGQFNDPGILPPMARQLPMAMMVTVFAAALAYRARRTRRTHRAAAQLLVSRGG